MENRGLLFIPDISGFTKFVNETEIEHSRVIIQELLELLINANQIGLEVSEIEGDAILFYKFGESPDVSALYHQVAGMFQAFHRHINAYDIGKCGKFCFDKFGVVRIAAPDADLGAFIEKAPGDSRANSGGTAGDDNAFARQSSQTLSPFKSRSPSAPDQTCAKDGDPCCFPVLLKRLVPPPL